MTITALSDSVSLAALLNNSHPLTAEDAAENPTDWLAGLWVAGDLYEIDAAHTTPTRLVLADGSAAVEWSPRRVSCQNPAMHRTCVEAQAAHWCPADLHEWTYDDARGVTRDWRTVYVWDGNGYSQTDIHPTIEKATAEYEREVGEMQAWSDEQSE